MISPVSACDITAHSGVIKERKGWNPSSEVRAECMTLMKKLGSKVRDAHDYNFAIEWLIEFLSQRTTRFFSTDEVGRAQPSVAFSSPNDSKIISQSHDIGSPYPPFRSTKNQSSHYRGSAHHPKRSRPCSAAERTGRLKTRLRTFWAYRHPVGRFGSAKRSEGSHRETSRPVDDKQKAC
jgi:hypothetical protein